MRKYIRYTLGILLLLSMVSMIGCSKHTVKGNGDIKAETRKVESFDQINLSGGNYQLQVTPGTTATVEVSADSNILDLIETKVNKNILQIQNKEGYSFSSTKPVLVKVVTADLKEIDAAGQSQISASGLTDKNFKFVSNGNVTAMLAGNSENVSVQSAGVANIDGRSLLAKTALAQISGAGTIHLYATDRLIVQISGTGNVVYYGAPKSIEQTIYGVGQVTAGK